MKIIKKSRLTNGQINNLNDPQKIMNEINIMKSVRHVSGCSLLADHVNV